MRLILLIGLPGSGKSTLADSFARTSSCAIVSTDAIRVQLFGDEAIQGSWLKVWLEVRQQFQTAVDRIISEEIEFAVYDATNAVRKQRREAIALARKMGFTQITGLWVDTPLFTCLNRNQERDRQVPEAVILRMSRRLYGAPPSIEDGLDGMIHLDLG